MFFVGVYVFVMYICNMVFFDNFSSFGICFDINIW